jgi:hypothetical protein
MIDDNIFKNALEIAYKAQGIPKAKRNLMIFLDMQTHIEHRDRYLDEMEQKARSYQAAKKASKKVRSEFDEQADLVHWFRKTYPDVWIYANRNGGSRSPREKVDQIREGVLAGVADLFAPGFKLYIEMKKTKGGVTSDAQIAFKDHVEQFGYSWILAKGFEDAKAKILVFVSGNENKT